MKTSGSKTISKVPHQYQIEALEIAMERNVILCLPTGSGKTFIAIMVINEFAEQLNRPFSQGGKRAFFLVPTKVLVGQQADALKADSLFSVGRFSGESKDGFGASIDSWTKTFWTDRFEKYQVLVMTRKIFLDILESGYISTSSIATIIFDEAHRGAPNSKGKLTADDYVSIMSILKAKGHPDIRIIGLTASLINNRWISDDKMDQVISTIEDTYDAVVYFPDCARGTKPKEIIWCYKERAGWDTIDGSQAIPNSLRLAASQIPVKKCSGDDDEYVPMAIFLENDAIPVTPKQIKHTFEELARICNTFGPWSLQQSLSFILKSFEVVCEQISHLRSSFVEIIEMVIVTLREFKEAIQEKLGTYDKGKDLLAGITNKMLRLLQVLYEFNQKPSNEPLSAIIFVERRLDAMVLSKWLNAIAASIPEYSFIKASFTVGSSTTAPFPFNSSFRSRHSNTIEDFKKRNLNIIVSTSVLEEGLDITHCNLIIRYDQAKTFRAYVQSKGRARSTQAYFVFFAPEDQKTEVKNTINMYHLTEKRLPNYQKPDFSSDLSNLNAEEFLRSTEGGILPYNESKNRVIFYCDHLPADAFTRKVPKIKTEKIYSSTSTDSKLYRCHLKLPKMSPLHKLIISGRKCNDKQVAEMDAYYEAVKILWGHEELDGGFRPLDSKIILDKLLEKYNLKTDRTELKDWVKECNSIRKVWREENEINGNNKREAPEFPPKPGTHKKRRHYGLVYSKVLTGYQSMDSPCWLYKVTLTMVTDGQSIHFGDLGLISFNLLPLDEICDKMSIYSTKDQLKVSFELIRNFVLKEQELENLKNFQEFIFSGCLKIGVDSERLKSQIFFTSAVSPYHLLFTFLTDENSIDFSIIKQSYNRRPIESKDYPNLSGALISKNYGPNRRGLFLVESVNYELSPKSKFPVDNSGFDDYEDYYRETYQVLSLNANQPLLACYPAPTRTYFPSQPNKPSVKSMKNLKLVHLIPEICQFEFFSGYCVEIAYTIPAIATALNRCLIASEIRKRLCSEIGYGLIDIPADVKMTWKRSQRFTNFVPLKVEVNNVAHSTKPVDLSYVTCKRYFKLQEKNNVTASTLSLDMFQGLDDETFSTEDSDDEDEYEYDEVSDFEDDSEDLMDNHNKPKKFNPEVLERQNSAQNDTNDDITIFQTSTTTIFSVKPVPAIAPVKWTDRDIKINFDIQKIGQQLRDQGLRLERLENDEIEKMVADSIKLNDFKLENSLIISTNSIYQDHSSNYKYGLPIELIIEAMTTKKHNPFINLERLEIIGDSFLKYIVSSFLFLKLYDLNEARITALKVNLISNFNLLHLGRSKGLAQHICDRTFYPRANWLPPFYSSANREFTEQEISDKSIADMVEAMIGAHLTCLGEDAAIQFLCWLGMPLTTLETSDCPSSSSSSPGNKWLPTYNEILPVENPEEINQIWKSSNLFLLENKLGYVFKRKDLLIEALTHPSWCRSRLNSYQRLEFIGDAVLDYLITSYIFDHPSYQHLTPGDVTYIRQALVNNDYFATISLVNEFNKFIFHSSPTLYSAIVEFRQQLINNDLFTGDKVKLGSFLLENLDSLDTDIIIDPPKALGDIFESIAGAIYLDSDNSLATVWRVYSKFFGNEIEFFCANVPKNPTVRLFEAFPNSKFIKEPISDSKTGKKRLNLIVDGWSFTVNEEELAKDGMNKRKERLALVLYALNTLAKDKNP